MIFKIAGNVGPSTQVISGYATRVFLRKRASAVGRLRSNALIVHVDSSFRLRDKSGVRPQGL
jgi:hypothetical protein